MIAPVRWWVKLLCAAGITVPLEESRRGKSWGEFLWRVVLAIPVIAFIILVTWGADRMGLFRGFETSHLDTMLRLRPREMSRNIVIVEVSEDDYHKLFNGTSPLDKLKLLELVKAIKQYRPSVIGVDIDTSDWSSACQKDHVAASCGARCAQLRDQLLALQQTGTPSQGSMQQKPTVVWAAIPKSLESPLKLNPVVGGMQLQLEERDRDSEGIPRFPIDPDGSVRHYESRVEVDKDSCHEAAELENGKCYELTLARAVLKAYPYPAKKAWDEPVIFNFYGDRYRFPTIESNNFFPTEDQNDKRPPKEIDQQQKDQEQKEMDSRRAQLLEGKIVLIGGGYAEARDTYFTPLGVMEGVVLNALAIETDLSGGGIREFNRIEETLADVAISIFIVWAFYWHERRPWIALCWSFVTVPAALVLSLIVFNTAAYWFNFIPAAAGMVCHQLYELAEGWGGAQEKLEEISRERGQGALAATGNAAEQTGLAAEGSAPQVDQAANEEEIKVKGAAPGAH